MRALTTLMVLFGLAAAGVCGGLVVATVDSAHDVTADAREVLPAPPALRPVAAVPACEMPAPVAQPDPYHVTVPDHQPIWLDGVMVADGSKTRAQLDRWLRAHFRFTATAPDSRPAGPLHAPATAHLEH